MPTDVKLDQGPRGDTVLLEGNAVVTGDLFLPALNTTLAEMNTTLAEMKSNLKSIQFDGSQKIDFAFSRIDRLETIVDSLVEFFGASVIPPWATQTEVEQGNDEGALGGGPAILSAEELGLIIEFKFEGQDPVGRGDVLSITPAPGTAVKRGSTVVVTVKG
jgi:hypothetical protein